MRYNYIRYVCALILLNVLPTSASEEILAKINLGYHGSINSEIKINNHNRFYALVSIKKPRAGRVSGCISKNFSSTRNCRVKSQKFRIHNLKLTSENKIIFEKGKVKIDCGIISNDFFGSSIKLNEKCKLLRVNKTIKEDDGLDIKKVEYTFVKFITKE